MMSNLLRFLLLQLLAIPLFMSAQYYQWSRMGSSSTYETGTAVFMDHAANVISIGRYQLPFDIDPGPGTMLLPNFGRPSLFLQKLSPTGQFQYGKALGSTNMISLSEAVLDANDNLLVAGTFRGTVDFDPGPGTYNVTGTPSTGDVYTFLLKLDANGDFVWVDTWGSPSGNINCFSMTVDQGGNSILCGIFEVAIDFDPGPGNMYSNTPMGVGTFVVKVSPNGSYMWHVGLSNSSIIPYSIGIDSAGNVILAGSYNFADDFDPSSGTYTLPPATLSTRNGFVWKLTSGGSFVWANSIPGNGTFSTTDIGIDPWNNIQLQGLFEGTYDFDPGPGTVSHTSPPGGPVGAFNMRLSPSGGYRWVQVFYSTNDALTFMDGQLESDGSITVGGWVFGTFDLDYGPSTHMISSIDTTATSFVLRTDSSGNFLYSYDFYGSNGYGMDLNALDYKNGTLLTTGIFSGTVDFDAGPGVQNQSSLPGPGSPGDYFVAKYSPCLLQQTIYQTTSASACGSYIWGGQTYTASGSYTQSFMGTGGCDSIVTLNLNIQPNTSSTQNVTACSSYIWPVNGQTYTNSGQVVVTIPNTQGCDSTITLNLTLNLPTTGSITQTSCLPITINGQTYPQSGTYTQTLLNAGGCDSTLTLQLTVANLNAGLSVNGGTLTATPPGMSYQWMDCGTSQVLSTSGPTFTPLQSGSYMVVVSNGICSDTSQCETTTSNSTLLWAEEIRIHPNPNGGHFHLQVPPKLLGQRFQIHDLSSKTLWTSTADHETQTIVLPDLAAGIYFLRFPTHSIKFTVMR